MPISLLEVNTFGHALCALMIYFLWWEKPFDVDFPTVVHSPFLWDAYASKWMENNSSAVTETFSRGWQMNFKSHPIFGALSFVSALHVKSAEKKGAQIENE